MRSIFCRPLQAALANFGITETSLRSTISGLRTPITLASMAGSSPEGLKSLRITGCQTRSSKAHEKPTVVAQSGRLSYILAALSPHRSAAAIIDHISRKKPPRVALILRFAVLGVKISPNEKSRSALPCAGLFLALTHSRLRRTILPPFKWPGS